MNRVYSLTSKFQWPDLQGGLHLISGDVTRVCFLLGTKAQSTSTRFYSEPTGPGAAYSSHLTFCLSSLINY